MGYGPSKLSKTGLWDLAGRAFVLRWHQGAWISHGVHNFFGLGEWAGEPVFLTLSKSIFREKCIIRRKKQFDEIMNDETIQFTDESFQIDYFFFVVDQAIYSFHCRFEQLTKYENIFGFFI